MSRDYDTTLARMAGNIAAGLAAATPFYMNQTDRQLQDGIARQAVRIAQAIIDQIRQEGRAGTAPGPTEER